jgi:hypothetical protein
VHVRLAPFVAARRRLRSTAGARLLRIPPLLLVAVAIAASGCRPPAPAGDVTLSWMLEPTPPAVGPARLTLQISDAGGGPARGAVLRVEGHMTHPGMAPTLSTAVERGDGVYEADLEFTMRGDWILLVSGPLPDGAAIQHRIDVPGVGADE